MAAIKLRMPKTFPAAIARVIGLIGCDAAAASVGKSEALVYKWGDPDCDNDPSLRQSFALDAACAAATGETPIVDLYLRLMQERGVAHDPLPPADRMLSGLAHMGVLANEVRLAIDPTSSGGCAITPTEEARIGAAIDELRATLDRLERDVSRYAGIPVRGVARA